MHNLYSTCKSAWNSKYHIFFSMNCVLILSRDQEVDGTRRSMTISGDAIGDVERFKYLG